MPDIPDMHQQDTEFLRELSDYGVDAMVSSRGRRLRETVDADRDPTSIRICAEMYERACREARRRERKAHKMARVEARLARDPFIQAEREQGRR